ncbi:MAG: hypothetical protein JSV30_05660 [Candidatus Omnitrophota bacterium]|nr:MAG: hypothetical protein JSV30_05660 [Candidatus Omnitrophota bacterium]
MKPVFVLIAVILIFALWLQFGLCQEEERTSDKIMQKLDKILLNQNEVFKQLDEIKKELMIVKMRSSR